MKENVHLVKFGTGIQYIEPSLDHIQFDGFFEILHIDIPYSAEKIGGVSRWKI